MSTKGRENSSNTFTTFQSIAIATMPSVLVNSTRQNVTHPHNFTRNAAVGGGSENEVPTPTNERGDSSGPAPRGNWPLSTFDYPTVGSPLPLIETLEDLSFRIL